MFEGVAHTDSNAPGVADDGRAEQISAFLRAALEPERCKSDQRDGGGSHEGVREMRSTFHGAFHDSGLRGGLLGLGVCSETRARSRGAFVAAAVDPRGAGRSFGRAGDAGLDASRTP